VPGNQQTINDLHLYRPGVRPETHSLVFAFGAKGRPALPPTSVGAMLFLVYPAPGLYSWESEEAA